MTDNNVNTINPGNYYTAYIVRDRNKRRFLNEKIYTGRKRGTWGLIGNARVFYSREEAQGIASNVNARRPEGYSAYFAEVRPVLVRRPSC